MTINIQHCLRIYEDPEFYEVEFSDRKHDVAFYVEFAEKLGGAVLELGCGTGRITQPIADCDIEIYGIDISEPMLMLARTKQGSGNIKYHCTDMINFDLARSFSFVFAATNAIQHVLTKEDILSCLKSIRKSLNKDAITVIDIFNPDLTKLARAWDQRYLFKNFISPNFGEIDVFARSEYITSESILHFQLDYIVVASKALIKTKDIKMHCLFNHEMKSLIELAGLKIIECYGDYRKSDFTSQSPKQIFVCKVDAF